MLVPRSKMLLMLTAFVEVTFRSLRTASEMFVPKC